ncbi:MAG TPA: ABATE domain-containing protein [Pseudonocardia sp.]|jgi:predicted RNA-binding Zn ribbon-like protein|nr:ABATE domain-containing protein [Pseudonocardia sp.]
MTEPAGFVLLGGRPCLDLVGTLGRRHAEPVERVPDAATLAEWLVAAGVLATRPAATDGQLGDIRDLREAVHRLTRATMTGQPWAGADVTLVNEVAARPDLAPQLPTDLDAAATAEPATHRAPGHPVDAALATLARDAVALLTGARTARIKECEYPDCSLLFFDDSQSGARRWCSMDRCGNLAKIAGYRKRVRSRTS